MRVLIVEDDPTLADGLSHSLSKAGYAVDCARHGEEADHMLIGQSYDLVILDLTIPGGMGGKETLEHLLAIDPQVKAIVSSGYSSDASMASCQALGFKAVIPKPYQIKQLIHTIQEVACGTVTT